MSTVSGRGMKSFVKGASGATRNVVFVYPRVSSGALAEYVKPDDVCLMIRDEAGSLMDAHVIVERVDDGGLKLAYVVAADCVNSLSVSVTVCGVHCFFVLHIHVVGSCSQVRVMMTSSLKLCCCEHTPSVQ